MNKNIINSLKNYNFTFEKNRGYGFIDDYEVNVYYTPTSFAPVFYFSTFLSQAKKNEFIVKMNSYNIPLVKAFSFDFGVMVVINAMAGFTFEKKFNKVLPKILETLESLEAPKKEICPQSGEIIDENDCETVNVLNSRVRVRLTPDAVRTVNSVVDKLNEEYNNAPNNYLRGFFGIFVGAIVGLILTILFAKIGFITALSPLVAIFLGVFLYKKLGGKQNKVMILMSFLTTTIVIMGTIIILYILFAYGIVEENGYYNVDNAFIYCLKNYEEFRQAFTKDVLLNLLFIIIAESVSMSCLIRMIKRPSNV